MANQPSLRLYWIPESIANVLHSNGIHNKTQLVEALLPLVDRATVYRAFPNDDYSGSVSTTTVPVAMARTFNVPLNRLVAEPATSRIGGKRAQSKVSVA